MTSGSEVNNKKPCLFFVSILNNETSKVISLRLHLCLIKADMKSNSTEGDRGPFGINL